MKKSVVKTHYNRSPDNSLFHYTTPKSLYSIVESKKLWVTRIQYLNDISEFQHAVDIALLEIRNLEKASQSDDKKLFESLKNRVINMDGARSFVFSLSEDPDLLSQWRAYCRSGGFSIGFDHLRLIELVSKQGFRILPCVYNEELQRKLVREVIKETIDQYHQAEFDDEKKFLASLMSQKFYKDFILLATSLKHPSFEEEKEWRLIGGPFPYHSSRSGWRPTKRMLIPYYEFLLSIENERIPITEIKIGPSENQVMSRNSLFYYLRNRGVITNEMEVKIQNSQTPYRAIRK